MAKSTRRRSLEEERKCAEYLNLVRVLDMEYGEGLGTSHGTSLADVTGKLNEVDVSIECKYRARMGFDILKDALNQCRGYARTSIPFAMVREKNDRIDDAVIAARMSDFREFLQKTEERLLIRSFKLLKEMGLIDPKFLEDRPEDIIKVLENIDEANTATN